MIYNKIKEKIKSNDGASLLFALLFFVMCAAVGAIVLTSASGVSGQLSLLQEKDREYYAVSSAADYIKTELANTQFTVTDIKTETYEKGRASDGTITYKDGALVQKNAETADSFMIEKLQECFSDYFDLKKSQRWSSGVDIYHMGHEIGEDEVYRIHVNGYPDLLTEMTFKMSDFGEIDAIISLPGESYAIKLSLKPTVSTKTTTDVEEDDDTRSFVTTKTATIKYESENISVKKV